MGVGRRPPPGIIPATALAGASSDIALDSSGMTPGEEQQNFSTCSKQTSINTQTRLADKPPQSNYSVVKKKSKKKNPLFVLSVNLDP